MALALSVITIPRENALLEQPSHSLLCPSSMPAAAETLPELPPYTLRAHILLCKPRLQWNGSLRAGRCDRFIPGIPDPGRPCSEEMSMQTLTKRTRGHTVRMGGELRLRPGLSSASSCHSQPKGSSLKCRPWGRVEGPRWHSKKWENPQIGTHPFCSLQQLEGSCESLSQILSPLCSKSLHGAHLAQSENKVLPEALQALLDPLVPL